jgi:hypothetical protein
MSDILDIEAIYRQERQRWMKEEAPRRSVRDLIADTVPFWIILVALVLYGLSAPHTASTFDKLTPGWGWIAPVGVEFGLLYAAFRRRLANHAREKIAWTLWALEMLLFLTAMLVNGAGAFTSVVSSTGLDTLSFSAILDSFGNLPATSQAALIMASLSAFIIPIGALVAGEGLATLALERRSGIDLRESRWREVEFTVTYRAIFVRYLQAGLNDKEAKLRAGAEVKGFLAANAVPSVPAVRTLSGLSAQAAHLPNSPHEQPVNAKAKVKDFLLAHPEARSLSINQLIIELSANHLQVGRTTVAEVLREAKVTTPSTTITI